MTTSYAGEAWLGLDDDVPVHAQLEAFLTPDYARRQDWGGTLAGEVAWIEHLTRALELRLPSGAVALVLVTGVSLSEQTLATVVGVDDQPF